MKPVRVKLRVPPGERMSTPIYHPAGGVWCVVRSSYLGEEHELLCAVLHVPSGRTVLHPPVLSDEAINYCRVLHEVLPDFGAYLTFGGCLPSPPKVLNTTLISAGLAPLQPLNRSS